MNLVCIDVLSLEISAGGYEHILVITDHFIGFAQAIPSKNQTAKNSAKILFDQFVFHYGFASRLHSDQGRNFESKVIKELCEITRIDEARTTPFHALGNGTAKRSNRTLLNMFGTLEDHQKADEKSTCHESTGYAPHHLMFGRYPRLAMDAFLGIKPDSEPYNKPAYVSGPKKAKFCLEYCSKGGT